MIILNDNIKVNAGKPSEAKYLNPNTNLPYIDVAQVNLLVPISERHIGLTVLINDEEYWYKDGVTNGDLVLKSLGGSGSGQRIEHTYTQVSHGFTGGTVVEYSGGTFIKALAVEGRNSEIVGLVSEVSGNDFTIVFSGYVDDSTNFKNYSGGTLSPNTTYYLSSNIAGGLTSVEPTIPTTISKPIFTTLTGGDGIVFQYRGIINSTGVTSNDFSGFTSAGNFGSGEFIYDDTTPSLLKFRSLKSGDNISVSQVDDEILFNFTGSTFTVSNGLSIDGDNIVLGGSLTGDTIIDVTGNSFIIKDGDTGTTLSSFELESSGVTSTYRKQSTGLNKKFYIGDSVDEALLIPRHETIWYVEHDLQSINLISIDEIDGIKLKSSDNLGNTPAQINIDVNEIKVSGNTNSFAGIEYSNNYISNFTQRSLVDKQYVDNIAAGLDPKASAHLATTGPLTGVTYFPSGGTNTSGSFTGTPSMVDGHTVTIGDRILVKDQVDQKQNGIYYLVSGSTWFRGEDQDGTPANEVSVGNYVFVTTGATYGGTGWVVVGTGDTLILNVDDIEWVQFNSAAAYIAGDGIDITGQLVSVNLAANSGLFVDSFGLKVDSTIAGNGLTLTSGVLDLDVENGLSISNGKVVLGGTLTGNTSLDFSNTQFIISGETSEIIIGANNGGVILNGEDVEVIAGYDFVTNTPLSGGAVGLFSRSTGGGITLEAGSGTVDYTVSLLISTGGTYFQDSRLNGLRAGIEYGADYSSDYTNRSLVDKEYVDTIALSASTLITADNGLTKIGNNIVLGGTLTGDTTIVGENNKLRIETLGDAFLPAMFGTGRTSLEISNIGLSGYGSAIIINANQTGGSVYGTGTTSTDVIFDSVIGINVSTNSNLLPIPQSASLIIDNNQVITHNSVRNGISSGSVQVTKDGVSIQATDEATSDVFQIYLNYTTGGTSFEIIDTINNRGIEYGDDYSANFTPRSLVDKAFVTGYTAPQNVYNQKVIITGNYTATTSNYVIFCNTTGSSFTITLPASPVDGQVYKIKDVGNAFSYNITVSGNGNTIDGSSTFIINTQRGGVEIVYDQTLDEWMVMNFVG